jgi:hypothetical protein
MAPSLSLVSTTEELHGTLYLQKLALTSPTSGGHLVGIVRSWTQATEFSFLVFTQTSQVYTFYP